MTNRDGWDVWGKLYRLAAAFEETVYQNSQLRAGLCAIFALMK